MQHVPMEPHVSVARVDLAGKVEVYTSAQSPFTVRHLLCACFSLPHGDVRVTCRRWAAASAARPGSTSSRSPSPWR